MIIGNGDIASVLEDRRDYIFFASGVSDSKEISNEEFQREKDLLLSYAGQKKHIVYFSSLCVFYLTTPYASHKRVMERMVQHHFPNHTIIRLGNITWGKNPNTIINFFKNKIKVGEDVVPLIRDEYRYLIDKEEFLHWISLIPEWSCEMNITGRRVPVVQIVTEIMEGKL